MEARLLGSGRDAERLRHPAEPALDLVGRHDVGRPLAGLGELELAHLGLDVPWVVDAALEPRVADPDGVRARQPAVLRRMTRPEHDHVEAFGPASQRVLVMVGDLDDAVAGAELADLLVLPGQA